MAKGGAVEGIIPPDPLGESPPFPIKLKQYVSIMNILASCAGHSRVNEVDCSAGRRRERRGRVAAVETRARRDDEE